MNLEGLWTLQTDRREKREFEDIPDFPACADLMEKQETEDRQVSTELKERTASLEHQALMVPTEFLESPVSTAMTVTQASRGPPV